jgi:ATP-dependent DNA helicase PIF1
MALPFIVSSRLGIMEGGLDKTVERALKDKRVKKRLKKVEALIIDEVSMISGITLAAAETIARMAREVEAPWGGMKIIARRRFWSITTS